MTLQQINQKYAQLIEDYKKGKVSVYNFHDKCAEYIRMRKNWSMTMAKSGLK